MRNDWLITRRNAAHLTQALGLLAVVAQLATWLLLRVDSVAWAGSSCGVEKVFGMEGWKGSPLTLTQNNVGVGTLVILPRHLACSLLSLSLQHGSFSGSIPSHGPGAAVGSKRHSGWKDGRMEG